MDISATYVFDAPAEKVWNTLMDPQALAACVPGCQSLESTGDNEYQAMVNVSLGPVRGQFYCKSCYHRGKSLSILPPLAQRQQQHRLWQR